MPSKIERARSSGCQPGCSRSRTKVGRLRCFHSRTEATNTVASPDSRCRNGMPPSRDSADSQ
jgi:hypothetical protein